MPEPKHQLLISKDNLQLLDPIQPLQEPEYLISQKLFPTIPCFVEALEYNDFVIEWNGNLPTKIFLAHPMAVPQGQYLTRVEIKGTKPDIILKQCHHGIFHAAEGPTCLWSLWGLSIVIDQKGHRIIRNDNEQKALIFTAFGAYWVTIPISVDLPTEYLPGVFATIKPETINGT